MRLSLTRSSVCKCSAPHSQSVLMLNQDVIAHAAKSAFEFTVAMNIFCQVIKDQRFPLSSNLQMAGSIFCSPTPAS